MGVVYIHNMTTFLLKYTVLARGIFFQTEKLMYASAMIFNSVMNSGYNGVPYI